MMSDLKYSNKKILVFGGGGFVGLSLKDYVSHDPSVTITLSNRNLSDYNFFEYDLIIHAAATADPKFNKEDPIRLFQESIETTKYIYNKILFSSARFDYIYLSSACVNYTKSGEVNNAYLESKRVGELYAKDLFNKGVNAKIARLFSVIGPRIRLESSLAINTFIKNGLNKKDLTLHPNASNIIRSYLHADEMCEKLLSLPSKDGILHEVGSSNTISIAEIAKIISEFYKIGVNVVDCDYPTNSQDIQLPNTDQNEIFSSAEAIRKTLRQINEQSPT
jgi:nucleoside-diphosphate-sugar epimerase